jgi:aryl-alcohol dehydrogenase-like predicted oxidoreductase
MDGRRAQMNAKIEKRRPQLESYEALCRSLGERPSDIAMAWLLHNPMVTAPITGPRTLKQLHDGLRALEIVLSEETLKKLDEIWPGPGGEAPQAYAW